MEWWKLFSGTFILIFLAELGDKTQLAAMAKVADGPSGSTAKWIVFFGASAALVLSTLIAVFFGHVLRSIVPDERYLKIGAALLFLLFGGLILFDVFRSFRATPAGALPSATVVPEEGAAAPPGYIGLVTLQAAMDFEAFSETRYREWAERIKHPRLSELMAKLAEEETRHRQALMGLRMTGRAESAAKDMFKEDSEAPDVTGVLPTLAEEADSDSRSALRGALEDLARQEEATAEFYRALSLRTLIPSLKPVFAGLAKDETRHADYLRKALKGMPA